MKNKFTPLIWAVIILALLLLGAVIFSVTQVTSLKNQVEEANLQNEELRLSNDQLQLTNEFDAINAEFRQYEDQATRIANDTILAKYTAAKAKVEQLIKELNSEKTKNRARIQELQNEIGTLKGLLRHYIAQIDSLNKENGALRQENDEVRARNRELSSKVADVQQRNETLTERMTLAEKLNVTGLSITGLKKNGKTEKNITKAKQLMVTFTIPQNNSTPVGSKTIYLRIVNPEGQLLGGGMSFDFEGRSIPATARKTIEYAGDEIPGVTIYWDVNTTLNPGDYTVELFTDGYRLVSRHFTLKK
ncbi:MAG: hypothetical protein HDR83_06640 [Bacteroides sp.]|nr:hypothetical protein [Bacteroidales bacterium]MBD5250460.1 hypothetical protein [Barnesiella sp.]MBD5344788.1 hypothetical protein [Bacteroides sp.]MDE5829204.1 hypothetical protein [Duncaniella sp.]MBD5253660.1 hypothetical protein [Barnesiella sp.]